MAARFVVSWIVRTILIASLSHAAAVMSSAQAAPGPIIGTIDGIAYDGDQAFLWGWACQQGEPRPIPVDIYVDHSAYDNPRGTEVVSGTARFDSEPAVNQSCHDAVGGRHRFLIALPSDAARKAAAGKLYAHGTRLSGAFLNAAIGGSGAPIRRLEAVPLPLPPSDLPPPVGSYHSFPSHPRVFTTAAELKELASRINLAGSYSMQRFVRLAGQIKKDVSANVDWEATYSGCDIDIYLHAFSIEARVGYASENRSEQQMSAAMHVPEGRLSPSGAAIVASRLALYAALARSGATLPPGAPSAVDAAALSKRILLAWATKGMRDTQGHVLPIEGFSCLDRTKPLPAMTDSIGTDVALQIGRGVVYSVDAQDLLQGIGAFDAAEQRQLDDFHLALFDRVRHASNKAQGNNHPLCEHFSNGQAVTLAGLLAVARLVDDPSRFRAALMGNERAFPVLLPWTRFVDGAIYGEADRPLPCHPNNPNGAFTTTVVAAGEIQDRYRGGELQTFGYPMGSVQWQLDAAEILRIAGFNPYVYRGRHRQSIETALQYYACYAKTPGFYKKVDQTNAAACLNHEQYVDKIVNGVDPNMVFGAYRFPNNGAITGVEAEAKRVSATGAFAFDATFFGKWRD